MKDSIVLFPALGRGHLISMVELGKLILTHHPSFSITILILNPPNNTSSSTTTTTHGCDSNAKYIATISATVPSITFHHIIDQNVLQALNSVSQTANLKAVIIDFLNYDALKVTNTLDNIPTYFYYTSGASTLAVFLQLPIIHDNTTRSLKELDTYVRIPGLPRIHTAEFPDAAKDRRSESYKVFLDIARSMRENDGIIVNTFDAIEGGAIRALNFGPVPVFCIGPVVSAQCEEDESGCLSWLDSQPGQSVVLLSFGSLGRFSKNQIKEVAIGLEKSEQRFLWVVRSELDGGDSELSLDELLPVGFLERTKERGLVVKNWAPQAAILSHDSVGGFVTHCGWNSVLEAVCEGVPMVAWPLYAEQKLNRVILVQEMKVALSLNESKDGLVSGFELGDRVKELMYSDKGKEIRQRIFKMKISAAEAVKEGGSSLDALKRLTESWREY